MNKIVQISPLKRTQEAVEYSSGRKAVRCYGPHNPHYFMDELGALQPIQIAQLDQTVSAVGDIFLRSKNVVSVGFRKDANPYKYLGLRPDFNQASGEEQLEFSIEEIKLDGQAQNIDLSKNQVVSPITVDLGGVIVRSTRQGTRQMVKVSGPIKDFRIAFKIHLKGLKIEHRADLDEYWIYNDRDEFRFRIVQPQIIDSNTLRPLEDEDGDPVYDLVKHSLIDNGDGTFTYIKEPDKGFALADPPRDFLIDADIVYSETSDGWLYRGDLTWEEAHDSETSETIGTADTCKGDAMTAFKIVDQYRIKRSYFYFDVSGLSGTVSSGSVNLYGYQYKQGNVCCQKGTQADTLVKEDYDSFAGAFYSVADWLLDQYNSMTLSAQGKTDLQSVIGSGTFKVCCREYDYDYLNVPRESNTPRNGAYYADEEGTTKDPYLEVTTTSGQTHEGSVSDGCNMGETLSRTAVFAASRTDGLAAGETPGRIMTAERTAADGVKAGETLARAIAAARSATDGVTLGETISAIIAILGEVSDGIKAGDTASVEATFNIEVSDGVELAETVGVLAQFAAAVTDGFKLGDLTVYWIEGGARITFTVNDRAFHFIVRSRAISFSAEDKTYHFTTKH